MYNKTVLNNGLRIITQTVPDRESVSVGIWIRTGSRDESKNNNGIAHFLEHLIFKGSKKYSCRQIKESIEGKGGALNGFTSEEITCYFAKLPCIHLNSALDVLCDMVANPKLAEVDIEKERFVVLEEIKMHKDLPQSYVYELLDNLLWPGQPLGFPICGQKESVMKLTPQELDSFQKGYYIPSNIVIAACGNLKHQEILKEIGLTLGNLENKIKNEFSPATLSNHRPKLKILKKRTAQTHLALGCYGIKRGHPDKHAIALLHIILGANMSSRLFSEVREKRGLAYEIGTQVKSLADTGLFLVHAGVDNAKVYLTLEVIIRELERIKTKLVSQDEFCRAKEFYIGQLRLALEDTLDRMFWMGEPYLTLNKTYSLSTVLKEVGEIAPLDIRRMGRDIFKSQALRLALIGPLKDEEKRIYACLGKL